MNYQMDGPNSMPWNSLNKIGEDIKIELTNIPPRDKLKYCYDLWTNGLSHDAFGIGRTYRVSLRSRSRGPGLWLMNLDSTGRMINCSFSGEEWESICLPSNKGVLDNEYVRYPDRYRPEIHRLVGGTWLMGKWVDSIGQTDLQYVPEIITRDHPFYQMAMKALNLLVNCLKEAKEDDQTSAAAEVLKKIKGLRLLTSRELEAESDRFHRIIGVEGEIPVEPPELSYYHYHALPILVEKGCGGSCTYCGLYKRKIEICRPEDVRKRIDDLEDYLGEEVDHFERVVLMEGDTLTVPTNQLISYMNYAKEKFSISVEKFTHTFSKAITILTKPTEELVQLSANGLFNVNIGLESGCQDLLDQIKTGQTVADVRNAILKLMDADINVSINIIAGAGGKAYEDRHLQETLEFCKKLPPGVKKYFSPLFIPEGCKYESQQKSWGAMTQDEIERQCRIFRRELEASEYMFIPI